VCGRINKSYGNGSALHTSPGKGENGKGKNWAKRGRGLVEKRLLPKAIYMQFSHIFCPYSVFPLHRNPASGCL